MLSRFQRRWKLSVRALEGHIVDVTLRNGSHIVAKLISSQRGRVDTVWLLVDETDMFVPVGAVIQILDYQASGSSAPLPDVFS
jgi:hypothetical protein